MNVPYQLRDEPGFREQGEKLAVSDSQSTSYGECLLLLHTFVQFNADLAGSQMVNPDGNEVTRRLPSPRFEL